MFDWIPNNCGFPTAELFNCIFDGNLSSPIAKNGKKRFSYFIDIFDLADRKQKRAVLLQLIGEKGMNNMHIE